MRRLLAHLAVLTRAAEVRAAARRPRGARAIVAGATVLAVAGAGYTVSTGDTLSGLAGRFGVPVDDIAAANDIDNPNLIFEGQVLTIPGQEGGGNAPASPAHAPDASTHVVNPGESLAAIAQRYGVSVEELARANGITDPDRIHAGALLRVSTQPPPSPGVGGGASGGTYTVTAGDTLSGIAASHGSSVSAIVEANGLSDADMVRAGQVLEVPGATGGVAWACPVPGGEFINDFGIVKPDGRYHQGVDVFAPRGTVVVAPVGGTVEHVQGARAGLQFVLHGDDGYTYIGTHLDSFGPAGRVEQGGPLGQVGTTGNAKGTSPHVHFEMHHGSVVNPYPTLRDRC